MERAEWLNKMRQEVLRDYDTIWAPRYGVDAGFYPNATHLRCLQELLDRLPEPGRILDAACGAGRYEPMLLESGHATLAIDQSLGMLKRLKDFFPEVPVEHIGLQEMPYQSQFNAAICMDAMEHVCPEDWPAVLANFHRALKPGGYLYFTVEIADPQDVALAFARAQRQGLPVVYGEWPDESVYHYYPSAEQVLSWLEQAGFSILQEATGDGYWHLIVQAGGRP